jgi:hypothetical protein
MQLHARGSGPAAEPLNLCTQFGTTVWAARLITVTIRNERSAADIRMVQSWREM